MPIGIVIYDENHNEIIGATTRPLGYKGIKESIAGEPILNHNWEWSEDKKNIYLYDVHDFKNRTKNTAWITLCRIAPLYVQYNFANSSTPANDSDFPDVYIPEVELDNKVLRWKFPAAIYDRLAASTGNTSIKILIFNIGVLWGAY